MVIFLLFLRSLQTALAVCAKNDAKRHKKTCPKLVSAEKTQMAHHLLPEEQKMFLGHQVHLVRPIALQTLEVDKIATWDSPQQQ